MTQHFRYTTLVLLTTLSTVYASAQSLRKLMEMPPRILCFYPSHFMSLTFS